MARSKKQIRKQTKDNKDLITELSFLRREDRKRKEDQDEIDKDTNRVKQEINRVSAEISKYKDLMRKMRLQDGSKQTQSTQIYNKPPTAEEQVAENYKRSQSKGKLYKGPLFNRAPMGIYKQQIQEKLVQLEESAKTILLQNLQITTLNDEFNQALKDHKEAQITQVRHFHQL